MTTTVAQIVRGALLLIGIQDIGESVRPEDAADGLIVFNDMVASWSAKNVHTGAGASALTDDSPLEERHTRGLKNLLAVELASPYGRAIPQRVADDARDGWALIQADYTKLEPLRVDAGLAVMPSLRQWNWWA